MQLKRFTDIGLRVLLYLSMRPRDESVSISLLAERLNWNKALVVKVSHYLVQQGWVASVRGRAGGLTLALPPEHFRLGQTVRALEGTDPLINCAEPACPLHARCGLVGLLDEASEAFYAYLDRYTLADLKPRPAPTESPIRFMRRELRPAE